MMYIDWIRKSKPYSIRTRLTADKTEAIFDLHGSMGDIACSNIDRDTAVKIRDRLSELIADMSVPTKPSEMTHRVVAVCTGRVLGKFASEKLANRFADIIEIVSVRVEPLA